MDKKIVEIVEAVHRLCKSLNLFESYLPKHTEGKTGEALFWRDVVNLYGLFCDCDRVLLREKENLFGLFKVYKLIDGRQYQLMDAFYKEISALRAWFCHNYDQERYFTNKTDVVRQQFLKKSTVTGDVPSSLEEMDWVAADVYIRKCFEEYLDLLADVMRKIESAANRNQIRDQWCILYAKALFHDGELLSNVLAEDCEYHCLDLGIPLRRVGDKLQKMRQELAEKGYSYTDIHKSIINNAGREISASEIVRDSIRQYNLESLI